MEDNVTDPCLETLEDKSLLEGVTPRVVFTILYVLAFLCCLLGNLIVLAVIVGHKNMRTVTNFFLANLAVADLFVGAFCILQNLMHILLLRNGHWPFGELMCKLNLFILHLGPCASAGILVLVSVERFVAISYPVRVRQMLNYYVLGAATTGVWIVSIIMSLPHYVSAELVVHDPDDYPNATNACSASSDADIHTTLSTCWRNPLALKQFTPVNFFKLQMISFVIWYVIPIFLLVAIYTRIGWLLWYSVYCGVARSSLSRDRGTRDRSTYSSTSQQTASELIPLTTANGPVSPALSATSTSEHRKPKRSSQGKTGRGGGDDALENRLRVIRMLVVVIVVFALLTLPHYVRMLWVARKAKAPDIETWEAYIQPVTYLLLFLNSGINPFIYAFLSARFRTSCADILCCRNVRNERRRRFMGSKNSSRSAAPADYHTQSEQM